MKPIAPKNREIKDGFSPREAMVASWIVGVSLVVFIFGHAFFSGCAKPPSTHDEWAKHCLSKSNDEFMACIDEWKNWKPE